LDQPTYYEVEFQVANPELVLKEGMMATVKMRQESGKTLPGASQEKESGAVKGTQKK
jgi:hypothetical protein